MKVYISFATLVYSFNTKNMNSGYSGTPLEKKLGLKDDFQCAFYKAPKTYLNWFNNLGVKVKATKNQKDESLNFIHAFCKTHKDLEEALIKYKPLLKQDGMFWVSWPKGSSKIQTDLKREPIRDYVLSQGLVDVKVAAIDKDWSGLKFVYRLKDRL